MTTLSLADLAGDESAIANAPPSERPGPWRVAELDAKLAEARERMREWGVVRVDAIGRWPERRVQR